MKVALLIIDKTKQIVLTPETEDEKAILKIFGTDMDTKIYKGDFYHHPCQGGYLRQYQDNVSIIICSTEKENEKVT